MPPKFDPNAISVGEGLIVETLKAWLKDACSRVNWCVVSF